MSLLQKWNPALRAVATAGLLSVGVLAWTGARSAEDAVRILAPAVDEARPTAGLRVATFAGGCFWGVQGVFQHVEGVQQALSGYAGGDPATAHYDAVSGGGTGHAEAVRVTYDPAKISYGKLLQIYFSVAHDPTQLNRQGPDRGTQYRSTVFPADPGQERIARNYIAQLDRSGAYRAPVVTTVEPSRGFYPAEDYHQDYLVRHPTHPYIVVHDLPKVKNLERLFPEVYRDQPALVAAAK